MIIIDSEENKSAGKEVKTRKLNFKIDESLEDVIPFSDIENPQQLVESLRKSHWQ